MVVLSPTSTVQAGALTWLGERLVQVGAPPRLVGFDRLEVAANVVMVVPLGLLGALVLRRLTWQHWAAYGFLGALAVELVQGVVLPARDMSASDVVGNTLGLLLGAGAVRAAAALGGTVPRRAPRGRG